MIELSGLSDFVQWTHFFSPWVNIVRTEGEYKGKFGILISEGNYKYMTVEELYEWWSQNRYEWYEFIKTKMK